MKRIFPVLFLVLMSALYAFAIDQKTPPYRIPMSGAPGREGFVILASDTTHAASGIWELVTRNAFTQMTVAETLRVISSETADSPRVTIYGVLASDSSNAYETLRISGTDSVFGAKRFRFFEAAVVDTEAAGTITITARGLGTVTTITPGQLQTEIAHHFTGKYESELLGWDVLTDTTSATEWQLRFYPDHLDAVHTPETGIRMLDRAKIKPSVQPDYSYTPPFPWKLHGGGYVAVFWKGTAGVKAESVKLPVLDR